MNTPDHDALLNAMLQADAQHFQHDYIANDGFVDAVMTRVAALPNEATKVSTKQRFTIIALATLLASVIAIMFGHGDTFLIDALMDLATKTITPAVLVLGVLLLSAGVIGISVAKSE
jgi:hypothetical protein